MTRRLLDFVRREPSLVISGSAALLSLAATFGLNLTPDQTKAVYSAVLTLVGIGIRSQVTPESGKTTPDVPKQPPMG